MELSQACEMLKGREAFCVYFLKELKVKHLQPSAAVQIGLLRRLMVGLGGEMLKVLEDPSWETSRKSVCTFSSYEGP